MTPTRDVELTRDVGLTRLDSAPIWAGLVGAVVMAVASILTALVYRGTRGERYSPFDHWVSELGELGVSSLAVVFNAGLVISGLSFAFFMLGLAGTRSGSLRHVYGVAGLIAGLAGVGVGLFPTNDHDRHVLAALLFFNLGWIALGLASIDIWRRPDARFPRVLSVVGAFAVAAFIAFLVSLRTEGLLDHAGLANPSVRPALWIVPTLEWAAIVGIQAWVFLTAWSWRRAGR